MIAADESSMTSEWFKNVALADGLGPCDPLNSPRPVGLQHEAGVVVRGKSVVGRERDGGNRFRRKLTKDARRGVGAEKGGGPFEHDEAR